MVLSRIIQVEQKLDGLVARFGENDVKPQLQSREVHAQTSLAAAPEIPSSRDDALVTDKEHDLGEMHRMSMRDLDSNSLNPMGAVNSQAVDDNATGDGYDLLQGIISHAEGELLLKEYRRMAPSFPFVPIPSNTSFEELYAKADATISDANSRILEKS